MKSRGYPAIRSSALYKILAESTRGTRRWYVRTVSRLRHALGLYQEETRLVREAQDYWNDTGLKKFGQYSHWRGAGIFGDESRWLALGQENLQLFEQMVRCLDNFSGYDRVVEWGCGGGANAIYFAPKAREFFGVDVSDSSLNECRNQLEASGISCFVPVLIDSARPEEACAAIPRECDLFICLYVFEVFPTPEYGLRVMKIAYDLLKPGGLAFVQTRYITPSWDSKPRRWKYSKNLTCMASYRIDEFWESVQTIGFTPQLIKLLPKQKLNDGSRYAYYLLQK